MKQGELVEKVSRRIQVWWMTQMHEALHGDVAADIARTAIEASGLAELEEANRVLELERDALERALRVRIWNERKAWGEKDDAAYKKINAEIAAIKTEAALTPSGEQPEGLS